MRKPNIVREVTSERFSSLMRNVAASVTVIATSLDGKHHGMTATAVCSVSADPPTILIVVNRSTRTHPMIAATKYFAISVLAQHQQVIGRNFASRLDHPFDGIAYRIGSSGSPIIEEAAAHLECEAISAIDVASHTIFIGRVIGGEVSSGHPLLYHEGEYKSLAP